MSQLVFYLLMKDLLGPGSNPGSDPVQIHLYAKIPRVGRGEDAMVYKLELSS